MNRLAAFSFVMTALWLCAHTNVRAQSSNPSEPTPITSERLTNRIEPRDIGDARPTTHFYTFEARPGDLEVQVVSENLNGDVDLFVADDLRPLTKVTLLASSTPTRIRRTIFLREGATLILRVIARSPGDEAGTYEVTFGGTFQASTRPAIEDAATTAAAASTTPQQTSPATGTSPARRVTSSGARIEAEPAPEVPAAARAPVLPESVTTNEERASAAPVPTTTRRAPSARRRRNTRPPRPPRANTRPTVAANDGDTDAAPTTNGGGVAAPPPTASSTPSPARARRPVRRLAPAASRLVIRTREGARLERLMIDVERVVIEGGELVVRLKSGEEQRLPLADVSRFTIEP